ncbi:cdkn1a interacting zinc finger protein 1a isoform X1 [Syngnathus acus]|uniref:cdkn1a interacting zinc finger protein 1a isoform X1 n=1 Tax=Syngnathus acus TaxID=161584 RepID=UPI0018864851|nr:cdkn1a interacting zinc finger protein 1a isoform X1 [Syngnathus acus]
MFNPHTHQQQQQQQQQFHQHLRQLQQLFQQQPPPPPPPPPPPQQPAPTHHVGHHHHQTPRAIPVPSHTTPPPPRMVNLCQASQTTIISPNPMLQGALMMQQMQGNMRGFGMAGQQFRQFFTAANRSLLGPVPIGMAMKSPVMGFPAPAWSYHPHPRYYNNAIHATNAAVASAATTTSAATASLVTTTSTDKKSDSEQMADENTAEIAGVSKAGETETDDVAEWAEGTEQSFEEHLEEPTSKRQRMEEGSEEPQEDAVLTTADSDGNILSIECNTQGSQLDDCLLPTLGSEMEDSHATEMADGEPSDKQEAEGNAAEGANKFYCYLCTVTCHSQENFRSHMNSVSHQQRMMEIQHMSNACLVTLLPRLHETLQGTSKDGDKKVDRQRWCGTCCAHYSTSISDHRRTAEHKVASRAVVSSCSLCKKHFRSSKIFVAHLQSQEHRQRLEKLQENESSGTSSKLLDIDGFEMEEEKDVVDDRPDSDEEDSPETQDGSSSCREVTLQDMTSDEQYEADTVYGSSFFVPVAGFICRLCNKFYHFDSSALHTHCKSLKHFENLKRHKESLAEKCDNTENSNHGILTGPPTDSPGEDSGGSVSNISSSLGTENLLQDKAEEPNTCQASNAPSELLADSTDPPNSADNTNEEDDEENALQKPNIRRRSKRASNRR